MGFLGAVALNDGLLLQYFFLVDENGMILDTINGVAERVAI